MQRLIVHVLPSFFKQSENLTFMTTFDIVVFVFFFCMHLHIYYFVFIVPDVFMFCVNVFVLVCAQMYSESVFSMDI